MLIRFIDSKGIFGFFIYLILVPVSDDLAPFFSLYSSDNDFIDEINGEILDFLKAQYVFGFV